MTDSNTTPQGAPSLPEQWLFVQMSADGDAFLTWCDDRASILWAVTKAVFSNPLDKLDEDESQQVAGITDSLMEDGFFDFEGDPSLKLFRVAGDGLRARAAQGEVAWQDVRAERMRQVSAEGWTPAHDDEHWEGDLSLAGAVYAVTKGPRTDVPPAWPWEAEAFKPRDWRRNLVKAGALILAEIERLDRSASNACADPMCACRGGPCAECPEGRAIAAAAPAPLVAATVPPVAAEPSDGEHLIEWGDPIRIADIAIVPQRQDGKHTEYARKIAAALANTPQPAEPAVSEIAEKLQDPVAVHVAMLRGQIAKPAIRDMLHVYGAEALAQFDRGAASAGAASLAVPEGWKLVPLESNDDMLVIGQEAWSRAKKSRHAIEDCVEATCVWRAMIAAAPSQLTAEEREVRS